ncbi:MAG: hypothetical protein JNJ44_07475 [Zoogloeaceae bacterium]|nr:hypothetical protein [Zoogloeaceae bacterium]
MAAYIEAGVEEANDDAAFIAKAIGDIALAKDMSKVALGCGTFVGEPLQGAIRETQSRV